MQTRSQTNAINMPLYEVNIDFDEASTAWRTNKKSTGNGCYKYICEHVSNTTGKTCKKNPQSGYCFCSFHRKQK